MRSLGHYLLVKAPLVEALETSIIGDGSAAP
jgi:hypothetical protein